MSRVHIVIFYTSIVCLFGLVIAEYIIPSEPFHNGGFGAEYILKNDTDMKYRILHRSTNHNGVFYIGGKGIFYRIDPFSESCPIAEPNKEIGTCERGGGALPCASVAPIDASVDCHNYIRIVEEFYEGTKKRLLVCGTNALEPRCYTFIFNETTCSLDLEFPTEIGKVQFCDDEGSYDAKALAPKNWNLNSSYLYSRDVSKLFVGVSKAANEKDPIWANIAVTEEKIGTSDTPFEPGIDTFEIESRAVNEANFVGKPYEYSTSEGDFVLFFYRETAVEFINHGKIVYSRVARVCRDDVGISYKWSSFLKARLNCSLPNDYPTYFNEIQDVSYVEGSTETYFYAVLATPSMGVSTSALCQYRLSDIDALFGDSKFKSPETSKSLWLPVDPTEVPLPRPGLNCGTPNSDTTFLQNNPLLDDLANNYNPYEEELKSDAPLFYTDSGGRFTTIAVDEQDMNDIDDNIYYIGTETGNVLKAYNNSGWRVFSIWQHPYSFQPDAIHEPITGLEFIPGDSSSGPWLYASTTNSLTTIDLKYAMAQNQDQYDMIYHPYLTNTLPKGTGVIVTHSSSDIKTCDNREINLFCEGRLDSTSQMGNITWTMGGDPIMLTTDKGNLIRQTHLTGGVSQHPASFLTVRVLDGLTVGNYGCNVWYPGSEGLAEVESKQFNIRIINCITDQAVDRRKEEFGEVQTLANERTDAYDNNEECLIKDPVLCNESCPYT